MDESDSSSFIYKSFGINTTKEKICITYEYELANQSTFKHQINIIRKDFKLRPTSSNLIQSMVFNIGMVALINYLKMSNNNILTIECLKLDDEQITWWKDFYLSLLGRAIDIKNNCDKSIVLEKIIYDDNDFSGYIVPLEDKDSCITLETLNLSRENDFCLILDNSEEAKKAADLAGFGSKNILEVIQTWDKKIVEVNSNDNSALIAFIAYFLCYLLSKKYIAVSNGSTAGIQNKKYGKSFDFENAFRKYADKFLPTPIEYFSFLRPLNSFQVAKSFAKLTKYHPLYETNKISEASPLKLSAANMNNFKLNSSYYLSQNNLIPEQEFILKKFLL